MKNPFKKKASRVMEISLGTGHMVAMLKDLISCDWTYYEHKTVSGTFRFKADNLDARYVQEEIYQYIKRRRVNA